MWGNFFKSLGTRHRSQLKILFLILLSVFLLLCWHSVLKARNAQKASVYGNASAYAGLMEEMQAAQPSLPLRGAAAYTGLTEKQGTELPFAPLSTFVAIKDGQVLSTEGYSPLSWKLVASVSEFARSASLAASTQPEAVYTYSSPGLPDYYFCYISSQESGLGYCCYEPALAGWPLFRQAFYNVWGFLLLLMLLVILSALILLFASPENKEENRVVEITVPYENDDAFGSRPYFSGIIIDYHNMDGTPASPDILALFDQIIRENLSVSKILFQFSSQRSSDCLLYYMNYNVYNLRVLSDSLKMNLYNAAPEYSINIFYSDAVPTYQEMEKEMLYLHRHLRYSLVLGYDLRLSIRQIRGFEASTEKMDASVAGTIQNHLRTRAYEDLYRYLRHFRDACIHFARPGTTQYSFAEIYRFAEESFSAVKLFFQENDFSHPMVQSSCSTVLRANPGFGHFCDYLISCIQNYQQENQHVLSSRNEQIMNKIYMYIEQDLADANLGSIARKMQMTDSHLSRLFKKNTGTNFSEYLSDRKLEEAARLLVQDNKIKVAEIADMLGYGNPTYFLSRFKAKYGISPTAYRKLHTAEN